MADKKITALTASTALSADDLFHVVDSPASSPSNKKIVFFLDFTELPKMRVNLLILSLLHSKYKIDGKVKGIG